MAERLLEMRAKVEPLHLGFLSTERAALLEKVMEAAETPGDRINLQLQFGSELLNAGESGRALQVFRELEGTLSREQPRFYERVRSMLHLKQAIAQLRWGEQANCLSNHTSDSCLLPIQSAGVHRLTEGSRGAIQPLSTILRSDTNSLAARWLLNIAAMTLGEYPQKVPPAWLIPPEVFKSDYELPRFRDVAGVLGLDYTNLAGGAIVEDFDGDELLDVMTSSMGLGDPMRFFKNDGQGTFLDRSDAAGLRGLTGGLNLIHADYDNDGFMDVLVLRGGWMGEEGKFPNSLLRNNGDGTFADVTEEAGLLSFHPTQTAVWFDFDNDGWLDLFIGNETQDEARHPCELFRNNGDGTFRECADASGLSVVGMVKGVASGDYNNDGRSDLYLSLRGGRNYLFRNDGPRASHLARDPAWKFTDVAAAAGVQEPWDSFPCWFFDYDNDGWLDLFVSGYWVKETGDIAADYLGLPHQSERPRLYHNQRDGTFKDMTREAGLHKLLYTMGSNFGDLDNDGWLDFYLGTGDPDLGRLLPNRMFRNDGGERFQDVTTSGGFGHLQKGHGVAFADIDQDGDQDVFEEMGGAYSGDTYRNVLFENPGHGHRWIKLRLTGEKSNCCALGARLRLTVETAGQVREIHRVVGSGGSFGGNPFRQEIGLGKADKIRELVVLWPSGQRDRHTDLAPDQGYRLKEGKTRWEPMNLKPFKIPQQARSPHHHH